MCNCVCITCFVRIKSRLNFAVKNGTQKIYSASWLNLSGALLSINPEQTPVCKVPQSSCFSGGESVGHKCKMFDHTHRQRSQVGGHAKLEDGVITLSPHEERILPEKKVSCCSYLGSSPQPFNHESSAVPLSYPGPLVVIMLYLMDNGCDSSNCDGSTDHSCI